MENPSLSTENLTRLLVALRRDAPLPRDLRDWLREGFGLYQAQGGEQTLDDCLGLRGRGYRWQSTHWHYKSRNNRIRHTATLVGGRSDWDRAQRLADEIAAFQRKRRRLQSTPTAKLTRLEIALLNLHRFEPIPATARQLYNILKP